MNGKPLFNQCFLDWSLIITRPQLPLAHTTSVAIAALLTGALVWGLIWYPFRALRDAGIDGVTATTLAYLGGLLLILLLAWRRLWPVQRPGWLLLLALAAGGCNLGYVLATLAGDVVRVLLLFYLAPLWTVLLARLLLAERLSTLGAWVIALSLGGAVTMLWHPATGWPWPHHLADWLGLIAGFCFALFNVLSRKTAAVPVEQRLGAGFAGVVLLGLLIVLWQPPDTQALAAVPLFSWGLLFGLGGLLVVINLVVQFGLEHTPANRAIVIMLSEVGFAALGAWLLAGEAMGVQEWAGGAMILTASLFSSRMEAGHGA